LPSHPSIHSRTPVLSSCPHCRTLAPSAATTLVLLTHLAWGLLSFSLSLSSTYWLACGRSAKYRSGNLDFAPALEGASNSRPVIAQLAANDPSTAAEAVRILQGSSVDGIDLNLGCPQAIAKRGDYGAYLLPQQDRVQAILTAMVAASSVPISAKIRIQSDLAQTLEIAKMIESTGVSLLTVHGRTAKENKTAVAAPSLDAIGAIVRAVTIPVIANGGLEHPGDIQKILSATGAAGVMSSEALLENPALFSSTFTHAAAAAAAASDEEEAEVAIVVSGAMMSRQQLSLAFQYLALAAVHYPVFYGGSGGMNCVMSHVFKILYRVLDLEMFHSHRARLAGMGKQNSTVSDVVELVHEISALFETKQDEIIFGGVEEVRSTSWYRRHRKRESENSSGSGGRPPLPVDALDRKAEIRLRMQQLKVRKEERRRRQQALT
jgi:tRNA-dihydrouridine synthase